MIRRDFFPYRLLCFGRRPLLGLTHASCSSRNSLPLNAIIYPHPLSLSFTLLPIETPNRREIKVQNVALGTPARSATVVPRWACPVVPRSFLNTYPPIHPRGGRSGLGGDAAGGTSFLPGFFYCRRSELCVRLHNGNITEGNQPPTKRGEK